MPDTSRRALGAAGFPVAPWPRASLDRAKAESGSRTMMPMQSSHLTNIGPVPFFSRFFRFMTWRPLEPVEGTLHAACATLQDVRVDLRRADIGVSEEFLHGADVMVGFQQVRCEAVAQGVA